MNVQDFIERWSGPHKESQDSHLFIIELLQLLGDTDPHQHVQFEKDVEIKALVKKKGKRGKRGTIEERLTTKHIDAYFPGTQVLLEMKSTGVDLDRLNSGEGYSSAFDQAKTYYDGLSFDEKGRWIVLSNFHEIRIHDMNEPNSAPRIIPLERLGRHLKELKILVNPKLTDIPETHIRKERDLSIEAGELVGVLYQAMLGLFDGDPTKEELKNLNILIVRLVFCFYADDAELFEPDQFHDFLVRYRNRPEDLSRDLMELFRVLDTPVNERNKRYMRADLYAFPYVNGGLFAQKIQIPQLSEEILDLILDDCSEGFRWDKISPTIFGALFESTLNPVDRREGGMHYTSIENIHKVIDLLFLDDLKAELERIKSLTSKKARIQQAKELQDRMAQLRFLDPACGSGNFLTESYISLRRIENELLVLQRERMYQKDLSDDVLFVNMTLVSIQQFYGIEINDFAVAVATTALYIAEAQMFKETEKLLSTDFEFLPLRSYTNIREGDALTMNWNDVIPAKELNYIMGKPTMEMAIR